MKKSIAMMILGALTLGTLAEARPYPKSKSSLQDTTRKKHRSGSSRDTSSKRDTTHKM